MKKFYIWGLDLSLTNTGVVIYEASGREFLHIGHINTDKVKKKASLYHNALKLKYIYDELDKLKELYPPTVIAIERGFSRFNTATQTIFRVHGLVNYMFNDIAQIYYPPKTVKEAIIKGDATKKVVQDAINLRYDVEFNDEDESDAFAVLITYLIKNELIEWVKPKLEKRKGKWVVYD